MHTHTHTHTHTHNTPEQARRHKPCVVFIDELDAVGGARIASSVHPYSRMTLNQLLVEMDGYKELEGVVIIGATNFPESLDKYDMTYQLLKCPMFIHCVRHFSFFSHN